MRDQTSRSVKLNREIARMLPEAMEKDRLVKIGYGSGGDTKPRDCLLYTSDAADE